MSFLGRHSSKWLSVWIQPCIQLLLLEVAGFSRKFNNSMSISLHSTQSKDRHIYFYWWHFKTPEECWTFAIVTITKVFHNHTQQQGIWNTVHSPTKIAIIMLLKNYPDYSLNWELERELINRMYKSKCPNDIIRRLEQRCSQKNSVSSSSLKVCLT